MPVRRLLSAVFASIAMLLASSSTGLASSINFTRSLDISTCGPGGFCTLSPAMLPVTLANGDTVDYVVNFANMQRLTMFDDDGGTEQFLGWLAANDNTSGFSISNASITLLAQIDNLNTPMFKANESSGVAHIGPAFIDDLIATGTNVSFTGYEVKFTVNSIALSPNTYENLWFTVNADRLQVTTDVRITPFPEPGTLLLLGTGLFAAVRHRARRSPSRQATDNG